MSHDHNHDHEERELITLVDEQGNETLFEILLTIDGKEEFGKNYVLLVPVNAEEDLQQLYGGVKTSSGCF